MRLLQDIALKIIEGEVCSELDTDIFIHIKPKDPDNIVLVAEYKGSQIAQFTNTSVRSVQITVRDKRNMGANDKIWKIYDLLHKNDNIIMIGNKLSLISLRHTPISIGVDEKGRYEWVLNLGITYNNTREE